MATSSASAQAQAWQCDAYGYLFQTPSAGVNQIFQVDLATGDQTEIANPPFPVNGVGFNVLDGFFYGMQDDGDPVNPSQLVRIHPDGSVDELGLPTGPGGTMPSGAYATGDVDPNGHYWVRDSATETFYEVDLTTPTPTVLRSGPVTIAAGISHFGADWGWINGALYAHGRNAAGQSLLLRFDPATGVVSSVGPIPIPTAGIGQAGVSGAVFVDASGYLYVSQNGTGNVYRINPTTRDTIRVSQGQQSSGNDGGRCAAAPIPTITLTKTVNGRVRPADQFTVGLVEDTGRVLDAATTSGAGTTASTTNWPVSQGRTYTITDAMATGAPTPIGEYAKSIACTDAAGNAVATGGSGPSWTLNVGAATFYTCNVTNQAVADLETTKSAAPSPVVPGEDVTFSVTAKNNGPSTAIGETITDTLPAEVTFSSASPGCSEAGGTVTCAVGELAPGASQTFTITARVASSLSKCLRNTATVSGKIDPNLSNNSSTICTPLEPESDLKITKETSSATAAPNGQVMFTLVVENEGPSDDPGAEVLDPLVAGLTLVSAEASQGTCSTANNTLNCQLGALKDGGSAHVLVTAQLTASTCVTNTAQVRGANTDPDPSNNQDSAEVCPNGEKPSFDLAVTKSVNDSTLVIGQTATYRVVVRNNGPDTAPNAVVPDTLNAPVTVVSVETPQGSCTNSIPMRCELGTIAAGDSVTITIRVKHREATPCPPRQRNAASAIADGTDTNPANNMDTVDVCVRKIPKLKITKVASREVVQGGQTFSYRIRVRNPSKGEATPVKVCDRLPSGLRYVSSKPTAKRQGSRQHCWTIKRLGAGKSKTFRVTVRAARGANGRKVNTATASSPDVRQRARARDPVDVRGVQTPVTG